MAHTYHLVCILIFFIVSFYTTLNLVPNSPFNAAILEEENTHDANNLITFRFLKELRKFKSKRSHFSHLAPTPAPAPAPAFAPSASPMPVSLHRQRQRQAHHPLPQAHEAHHRADQKKGSVMSKALVAILVSVGVVFVMLLCGIGLFFGYRRFKGKKRRQRRNAGIARIGETKYVSGQVKKVVSDPRPDLFYLDTIESALESERCCLKGVSSGSTLSVATACCDEDKVGEIAAAADDEPSDGSDSSRGGDRIIPVEEARALEYENNEDESEEDDDESFHSVCESQASQLRLSNASSCSVGENLDTLSIDEAKVAVPPPPPPPPPLVRCPVPRAPLKTKCIALNSSSLERLSENSAAMMPPPGMIPPPPRPPPRSDGQPSSLRVPPPPLPQQIPLGKDGSPLPKLKPLHWDKVRAAPNRTTVWDKLRSSSFEFDEEMIESLFGYNLHSSTRSDESKSKTPSPDKHILDPKRLQNFIILSKALSVNEEQVCEALIRGDGLSLQDLEVLSKMVPTKDEEAKLVNYKGDLFDLSLAEKLVKAMLKISFAFSRIEAMLYRETFEDEVLHLRKSFSMLEEACKELRSSRLFLKLLEAVLKTGNRMNIGTIRGGAKAFKLDTLLKLSDVKGTDGRTTLLHFVVLEIIRSEGLRVSESIMGKIHQKSTSSNSSIQDKEENYRAMGLDLVSGLSTELCNVKKTATIDLDVLASSVANLSDAMHRLQQLVEKDMVPEDKNNSTFMTSHRSFLKYAETKLKELQEDENRVLQQVREITEYFHGDKSKDESNPLRIFVIVRDFLSMLDHVCKELKSSKAPRGPNPLAPFR